VKLSLVLALGLGLTLTLGCPPSPPPAPPPSPDGSDAAPSPLPTPTPPAPPTDAAQSDCAAACAALEAAGCHQLPTCAAGLHALEGLKVEPGGVYFACSHVTSARPLNPRTLGLSCLTADGGRP
jgi:hypothetical protein